MTMRFATLLVAISMWRSALGFSRLAVTHSPRRFSVGPSLTRHELYHLEEGEADIMEQLVGGERYSIVPLPDSMMDTTLFVGNLCEFVQDGDLSQLFEKVCNEKGPPPPACVSRKPNRDSLQYGFVTFATQEEKEVSN